MAFVWCGGDWIEAGKFSLPATDRGATLGLALFETMLAVDGRPQFIPEHQERWRKSCDRLGWVCPEMDLAAICRELAIRNDVTEGRARLRLTMTAGAGQIFEKSSGSDARIWITAVGTDATPQSVAALLSPWRRNEKSPLAGLKTASYAENILALDHARSCGYDETLFLNTSGQLCEAATSNVFLVQEGRLLTPPLESGCLPGVARSVIIRLARQAAIDCVETSLTREDLEHAEEIFLTSALRGPVPVSRLDERSFSATPVADLIRTAWLEEICRR